MDNNRKNLKLASAYSKCSDNNPIKLSRNKNFDWNDKTRIGDDICQIDRTTKESIYPGCYSITGNDPTRQDSKSYAKTLSTLLTHQKAINNTIHYVDCDTELLHVPLTNLRTIHQLSTRPYVGSFQGPGKNCPDKKEIDTESFLWQGLATFQKKPCQPTSGLDVTSYYFNYLPCFGNPQKVEHVVEPPVVIGGWVRGGATTRDQIRQINYRNKCLNKQNNKTIFK